MHVNTRGTALEGEAVILEVDRPNNNIGGRFEGIHHSHKKRALRSLVFCKLCGLHMHVNLCGLKEPCRGKPSRVGKTRLRRMLDGYHPKPERYRTWDDGVLTRHKFDVVSLD